MSILPYRLFFFKSNFMVADNVRLLETTMRQAKAAGYNGVVLDDFKFHILDRLESQYFRNIENIKSAASGLEIDLYPTVGGVGYSNGILTHDPNLAEGLPVVMAPFQTRNGMATLIAKLPLPLDKDRMVDVARFRQYHLSVAVKTANFMPQGAFAAVLTAAGHRIAYFDRLPASTQDWTTHHLVFNSLDNDAVEVRPFGWLHGSGEFSCKDAALQEVGLINVIRRAGAPLVVAGADDGILYHEGLDFELEANRPQGLMPRPGEYDAYYQPPRIVLRPGTRIRDGQRLSVSYYHAGIVREGGVTCCLSAPEVYQLIGDQIFNLNKLLQPRGFFLNIDEVRIANWCQTCRVRAMTPGQLLADSAHRCLQLIRDVAPGAAIFVWSDMFDPFHNAHDHYFLLNGDAAGSWEGLDKDVIIANWNFIARAQSLGWFSQRGHRQVIAAYYDQTARELSEWSSAAKGVSGIEGAMYTTWRDDYSQLNTFADVMWNGND